MSNIPNSAMPHAWAKDEDKRTTSANQLGFTLAGLAIAGAVGAIGYLIFRKR